MQWTYTVSIYLQNHCVRMNLRYFTLRDYECHHAKNLKILLKKLFVHLVAMCCVDFIYVYSFKYTNLKNQKIIVIIKSGTLVTVPRVLQQSFI